MAWCDWCDRYFVHDHALQDHYEHSSRHNWCRKCDRHFTSDSALLSHRVNSSSHNYCRECGEDFDDSDELDDHIDSEHWHCDDCDVFFKNEYGLKEHYRQSANHHYCVSCDRHFRDENSLRNHLRSTVHVGRTIECNWCPKMFPSLAALTLHLESSSCTSGIDRAKVNAFVRSIDKHHVITTRLIKGPSSPQPIVQSTTATEAAWNGRCYECYFCSREYRTLAALNQHLNSPAHEAKIYKCPHCRIEFKCLSSLVQHVESEKCGVIKFSATNLIMDTITSSLGKLMLRG